MKEWRNLEKNLPDSIYVRVYEGRLDLMRAAIIGADGTPYHDGIFLFDIKFPASCPNEPPLVNFHAHGMSLNPNLYSCGKVCPSLLNTWKGLHANGETWDPSKSTMLQVLLSIQALVLNNKPYRNDPWAIVLSRIENNLKEYNKHAFTLSCKLMLCAWRNPPKNFEGFVKQHFERRANKILQACKDYGDGKAVIGEEIGKSNVQVKVSKQWKMTMKDMHKLLDAAFNKKQDIGPNKLPTWDSFPFLMSSEIMIVLLVVFLMVTVMVFGFIRLTQ